MKHSRYRKSPEMILHSVVLHPIVEIRTSLQSGVSFMSHTATLVAAVLFVALPAQLDGQSSWNELQDPSTRPPPISPHPPLDDTILFCASGVVLPATLQSCGVPQKQNEGMANLIETALIPGVQSGPDLTVERC